MNTARTLVGRLIADERGATAMEYALLLALLAMAIIGSVTAVGAATGNKFNEIATL